MKSTLIAFFLTFFEIFDVPVFWVCISRDFLCALYYSAALFPLKSDVGLKRAAVARALRTCCQGANFRARDETRIFAATLISPLWRRSAICTKIWQKGIYAKDSRK